MAVKGLWEAGFGGRLGVWGPRTPKLPRAPRNRDPALPGPRSRLCRTSRYVFHKEIRDNGKYMSKEI